MNNKRGSKNLIYPFKHKMNKRGIISDYLPWLLIAIAVLAIVTIFIFVLKDKGISLIDKVKDLLGGI